jgi:preprotein translocase subunit SecE
MPEMGTITEKIRTFILETIDEMRKCTWPTRDQLFESTILVIVALILSTIYLAGIDQILYRAVRFLTTF